MKEKEKLSEPEQLLLILLNDCLIWFTVCVRSESVHWGCSLVHSHHSKSVSLALLLLRLVSGAAERNPRFCPDSNLCVRLVKLERNLNRNAVFLQQKLRGDMEIFYFASRVTASPGYSHCKSISIPLVHSKNPSALSLLR